MHQTVSVIAPAQAASPGCLSISIYYVLWGQTIYIAEEVWDSKAHQEEVQIQKL